MDSDERVMALKKAYADIILNTAKEAAARVIKSERKAQRSEHELKVAKEESLRMLLRIKQMLDAKVSEAELTALSQKKKIDELEAQLHEAEDIVKDVREELREVQSELERMKDKAQCIKQNYTPTFEQLELNRVYTSQLAEFPPPESYYGSVYSHTMLHAFNDQRNAAHNYFRTPIYSGYADRGSPDLPSIISRRKVPLFYRNGGNQRIRACQTERLDQEFTLSAGINTTKDEISVKEVEGGKVTCNLQMQENENKNTSKKKVITGILNPDLCLTSQRKRTSASHLKNDNHSSRNIFGESTKADQELPCLTPNSPSDDTNIDEDHSEISPRFLSRKGELSMHLECSGNSESGGKLVNCSTGQGKENRQAGLPREMTQQNMEHGESTDIMDPAKGSPSSIVLEPNSSETGNQLPKQTISDGTFKYTFQRKRKRDSLVDENDSPENNLPEEYVRVENNNILHESCDVENDLDNAAQKMMIMKKIGEKCNNVAAAVSRLLKSPPSEKKHKEFVDNILGVVALLGSVQSKELSMILSRYIGEDQMLAVVCKTYSAASAFEMYELGQASRCSAFKELATELGCSVTEGSIICLEDVRSYPGRLGQDPQGKLALLEPALPDGSAPPGYLGYAVNMIHLDADNLQWRNGLDLGLRETIFYGLLGKLQVYENKDCMNKARSWIEEDAVSLDGGIMRRGVLMSSVEWEPDIHFPVLPDSRLHDISIDGRVR